MEYLIHDQKEKQSVALSSILGAVLITGMKLVVGIMTGSLGILAEAMHSGLDLVAAIITFFAVNVSGRPADKTHLYGHGKVESISALVETLLLLITCGWIIYEAVHRLFYKSVHVEVNFWSFFVIVLSIVVDVSRSRALYRVAKKYKSEALEADALHFSTDIWSSSVVLLGLALAYINIQTADSIAAMIVAFIVIFVSIELGKRTIDSLLDKAPHGMDEQIRSTVAGIAGVEKVDNVRIRQVGPKSFVDLTVQMKRSLPFETAHGIVNNVELAIKQQIPNSDIIIHPEPVATADETLVDKLKLFLTKNGYRAHDIQVFELNGTFQVEFQLEFEQAEQFVTVHSAVDEIEEKIKREFPDVTKVIIHIEDSRENIVESEDVTETSQKLSRQITTFALAEAELLSCDVVSVLKVQGEYRVSLRCTVNKTFSLEKVHQISTMLENKLMVSFPYIKEVTIHAEPSSD